MNDVIGLPFEVFWGLMIWLGMLGAIFLSMFVSKIVPPFIRDLRARRRAETETAPKGRYVELRDQVERASRGVV